MEFIVTPFHVEDITRLHEANADGVVVAMPFFRLGALLFLLWKNLCNYVVLQLQ